MTRFIGEPSTLKGLAAENAKVESLARRPAPVIPASTTARGEWSSPIRIPLFELAATGHLYIIGGGNPGVTLDSTYPYGAYVQSTLDGRGFSCLINIGPQRSHWRVISYFGIGPDYGIVKTYLGTVEYLSDWETGNFDLEDDATITYVLYDTNDCYNATEQKGAGGTWVGAGLNFAIRGNPGVVGTSFGGGSANPWDGGPGPMRLKFVVDGKNASSTGFKFRAMGVVLVRLDRLGLH